ncbi:hypothetical protein Chor_009609 [Crotalus horridus]
MALIWICIALLISLLRRSTGQSVDQTSGIVTVTGGQLVSLNCSYEKEFPVTNDLFWYIQHPGQPLKFFLASYLKNPQGFQATHVSHANKKGTFNLQIHACQLKDSAVYFCASSETLCDKVNKKPTEKSQRGRKAVKVFSEMKIPIVPLRLRFMNIDGRNPDQPCNGTERLYVLAGHILNSLKSSGVGALENVWKIGNRLSARNYKKNRRGSTGQSVDQTSGILTVTEEQPVSLNCSYEGQFSINYPFWYIQHPSQPLEILLTKFDNKNQDFQAIHYENKNKGTFNMRKPAIQLQDSAVYFCAFKETEKKCRQSVKQTTGSVTVIERESVFLRGSTGQLVNQTSGIVTVTEGQSLSLRCSYEAEYSGTNYPSWYIQHPGQPLEILLDEIDKKAPGFQATHNKTRKKGTFNMQKQAIQLEDSAVYFCAFSETQ